MKDKFISLLFLALIFAFTGFMAWLVAGRATLSDAAQCTQKGGLLVRTQRGLVCIAATVIPLP